MKPYALVVNDFLSDFASFREFALSQDFDAVQPNPVDGYAYPHTIPLLEDRFDIQRKLELIVGAPIVLRLLVLRMSPAGVVAPEQVHSDLSILDPPSQYSAVLYCNEQQDCSPVGGTSFLRHISTGDETGEYPEIWKASQNDAGEWDVVMRVPMEENRIVVFPSCLIHRSEPIDGFGIDKTNARMVLVALFDIA